MMDLYTTKAPNGHKVTIALEELKIPYQVYNIQLKQSELFHERFLPENTSGIIPVLVDRDKGLTLFESGNILLYLAEKSEKFLPENERGRFEVIQWLFTQNGSIGPTFGELIYYKFYAKEEIPYAYKRYFEEAGRILQILNTHLKGRPYIAGQNYTIADMGLWPWVHLAYQTLEMNFQNLPFLKEWYLEIHQRPAVQRGIKIPEDD